ncbi:peptide chain release factor N(5)-glutamine methyltransferase, partial [Patescibacteria group bacterium]|nr:peptide chain release factor N(5)-glutamine methyltransferase [Patescibacteria group bacterium]
MQINQALKFAIKDKKLSNLDAEVLLCFVIKKDKAFIYSHPEFELNKTQENKFKKFIARRIQGEPVAYVTEHKEFYGLDFLVNKNVLIPRPETEILVEESLTRLRSLKTLCRSLLRQGYGGQAGGQAFVLEIGTGSGCIIISIIKRIMNYELGIKGFATDISKKALNVAIKNS